MSKYIKDGFVLLHDSTSKRIEDIPLDAINRHYGLRTEKRELVVEWWEIQNKNGCTYPGRVFPEAHEMPKNLLIPAHGFESKEVAEKALERDRLRGPYLKLIHVRRTRKAK